MRTKANRLASLIGTVAMFLLLAGGSASAKCTAHSRDRDRDGVPNCLERMLGTNPQSADTDHDGLSDGQELMIGTNPNDPDTDGDGMSDGMEAAQGHDPTDANDNHANVAQVKIESPIDGADPSGGTVSVLGGRLTLDASHANFDNVSDLAELKAKLDAAGKPLDGQIRVDPASLAGSGRLVAEKVELLNDQVDGDGSPEVRCCLPEDDGNRCEIKSMHECGAEHGLDMGPGSCDPSPCP